MHARRLDDASAAPLARRPAVIAFLDVVGYAALVGADEEATLRRWDAMQRDLIEPRVARWGGRIVDRAGDGLLLEFPGAVEALRWAVEVQAGAADPGRTPGALPLRIAVHSGHVFDGRDGRLHGDGVNTAARLQAYAEPGGVIVSAPVREAVAGHLEARFLDLGALHLRHIAAPVRASSLRVGGPWPARRERRADPRPSIAVLPFHEARAGAGGAYFAQGIAEAVIHALAGLEQLFVVSRGSTLAYAGAPADPRAVGQALGVRYVLHGSVARTGDRLRIAVELDDAESGAVVQAQRHEGATGNLFELQDRISVQVASRLAPQLRERELRRALRKHPESMDAYDLVLQALDRLHRLDRESFARARGFLQQSIAEDPDFAPAFSYSAWWHVLRVAQGWSPHAEADAAEADRLAAAAVERDGNDPLGLAVRGYALAYGSKDFDAALALLDRALAAGPSCALAWSFSGVVRAWLCDGAAAVRHTAEGLRLSPFDPFSFLHEDFHAVAHLADGDHDTAVTFFRRADAMNPRHAPTLRGLAACLLATGRRDEACETAQRMLAVEPTFRVGAFAARTPLRGAVREAYVGNLRALGLPE
jgi:TolB-like protein/class 3 adenylate cyclase